MGIYDSRNPYPKDFDDLDECINSENCPFANGECFDAGECLVEKNY